jgi:GNAT superfamily N-acetyltransferase
VGEPEQIGRGIGSRLFRRCADEAWRLGARRMDWEAEPNAVGFYKKMGAQRLRDSGRTMWGRVIDVMGVKLSLATSQ